MSQMVKHGARHPIESGTVGGGAIETLRRETLLVVARILIAMSLVAVLPALWLLPTGQFIPFATAIACLATGVAAIIASERRSEIKPLPVLLIGMSVLGASHAVLNPALADFGLATASLVPVLVALLGDRKAQQLSWALLATTFGIAVLSRVFLGAPPEALIEGGVWSSAFVYLGFAFTVAVTALRLGAQLERTEKAQTDTFRHLIENFRYVALRLSPTGETLFVSRTVESLLGCQRFELTGHGVTERLHVQDRPKYLTALSDAANSKRLSTLELRMRKDTSGSTAVPGFIWVECALSPVQTAPGATGPFEVMVLLRDITERVTQREEMNRARLAAQEASRAKSRFLATIGHELRTPLNAVVGFSDMLRNGIGTASGETQREYAELIHQSGMHLLDTVNMLLDMSKIEAGKFELQIDEFSPESLMAPSIGMVEPMARSRRIGISVEVATDLPRILGDERAYRQIAINLMSNAVKFSHSGGEVRVALTRRGRHVAMAITDDGIGMAPDVIARLGEPFFQANQGLSRRFEGSGLGLSIVKGLIDLHGGRLEVHSRAGKGTTITVLMPITGPSVAPAPTEVVAKLPGKSSRQQISHAVRRRAAR